MKKRRLLTLLPLIALLLSGCETGDTDMGDQDNDGDTQETGEPDTSESNPSEPSSSEDSPSENPAEGGTSGSTSGTSSDSHTPVITYSLVINNKDSLTSISNSEDNPNTNVYSLDITLYTYTDEIQTEEKSASETDVTITSSNDNAIAVNGLTLILGSESDTDVTLTATWNEHDVSDTVNINYTYTPHQEVISYEYEFNITNKDELTSEWKIGDNSRVVQTSLIKYTLKDGVRQEEIDVTDNPNGVTLSQVGDGEVTIDNLTISPKTLGSLTLSACWTNGESSKSDSVELLIDDSYYESDYSLVLNNKSDLENNEESPWVQGTGSKELDISLNSNWYSLSSGEVVKSASLKGTTSNVSIKVFNENNEEASSDITYFTDSTTGGIRLSLAAVNSSFYTILLTWDEHQVSDYFKIYVQAAEVSYSISVTNESEIKEVWYVNDPDRTLTYEVYQTTNGETTKVDTSEYINAINIYSDPTGYVEVTPNSDSSVTLSLLEAPEEGTTLNIYLSWESHDVTTSIALNLSTHNYEIKITNTEELMASWSIEDQITREVKSECYIDSELQSTLGIGHVVISSSDETQARVDGNTISAVGEGSPTISATWYKDEDNQDILASDSVILSINDNVKATAIKINALESNTIPYMEEVEISASVTGKDGREATDPEVTWESSNETGISVAVDSNDSTKATVTGLVYSAQATITATCGELTDSISLDVAAKEEVPVKVHSEVLTPYTISSPDDRGVYVLGTENGDTYLAYDNAFTTTTSYDEAAAIRVVAAENGYYLELGDKYIANSTGSLILKEEAYLVNIDQNGAITDGDYTLGLSDNTLSWVNGETSEISLLDVKYTDQAATYTASQLKDEDLYFACEDSDGYFHYYTGSVSGGHGSLSSDITEAVKMSIEDLDNNQFYLKDSNGKYLYIYIDGTGGCKSDVNANPVYYDSEPDTWRGIIDDKDEDGNVTGQQIISRFFAYYTGGDMRTYDGNYAPFRLYFATEVPQVKGITIHVDENDLASKVGHTFTPTVSQYPEVLDGIHSVSSADLDYTTVGEGSISVSDGEIAFASAGKAKITGTYKSVSDSFDVEISEGDGTKELTYTHDVTNNTSSKSGDIASTDGGTFDADGLTWTYTSLKDKGTDSSSGRGFQIGSGSESKAQTDTPWTLSTDFGDTVKLSSITINISVASSGSGLYTIAFGETTVADSIAFSNTSAEDKTHTYSSGEEPEGQTLSISLLSTAVKAMYIKTISFTIIVDENYQLPLYAEA